MIFFVKYLNDFLNTIHLLFRDFFWTDSFKRRESIVCVMTNIIKEDFNGAVIFTVT